MDRKSGKRNGAAGNRTVIPKQRRFEVFSQEANPDHSGSSRAAEEMNIGIIY